MSLIFRSAWQCGSNIHAALFDSFCIAIRTLTSRLYIRTTWVCQTPPPQCAFLKFEFLHPSTVLMIPLSFAHHLPVDHHNIPHLVHHAYSLACYLQLDATHTH